MILGALWRGECRRLTRYSMGLDLAGATIGVTLIGVIVHAQRCKDIRAFLPSELLLSDLCLGDALAEELQIDSPEGAVVLALSPTAAQQEVNVFALLAEAFHAKFHAELGLSDLSLLVWALRSFAERLAIPQAAAESVICDILAAPRTVTPEAFYGYLRDLEADFVEHRPDASLSDMLQRARDSESWALALHEAFALAATVEEDL